MRTLLILISVLALPACDRSENTANAPAERNVGIANSAAELAALHPRLREGVLFRAIRDAGLPCQDVVKVEQISAVGDRMTWRATCEDHAAHLVTVGPDGYASVVSRNTP